MKKMSCPGLVAKSGISWTLRAGQAGQGGQAGVVVTKTRGALACATWRDAQRVEKSFLGHRPTTPKTRGRRALGTLGRSGGVVWACILISISGKESSGGSHLESGV